MPILQTPQLSRIGCDSYTLIGLLLTHGFLSHTWKVELSSENVIQQRVKSHPIDSPARLKVIQVKGLARLKVIQGLNHPVHGSTSF